MYSWFVGIFVRRTFSRFSAGDVEAVLSGFAEDAHFVFPGRHSFAADTSDPAVIRRWFERFVANGPNFEIGDVLAAGPPWNLRVAVRFTDRIVLKDGLYENHGMQYLRIRMGRVQLDQIYLDTQALAAVDDQFSAN